jgi:outer membrane receptor protein involved in Fe transport
MTGGSFMLSQVTSSNQTMVRGITLGLNTDFDPANAMFNATNFPGASSGQLADARDTYAVLTGRVASVASTAVLDGATGQYVELGPQTLEGSYQNFGSFFQDTWRVTPTLTLTGGLRYDITTPFAPSTSVMSAVTMDSICGMSALGAGGIYSRCNFLSPGASGGPAPQFILLDKGTQGFKTDRNNLAPSASIAWRPNARSGFLRALLGDPDQATLRAGYSEAYDRQGLTRFTGLYGGNRGASISLTRNANTGLVGPGESWPVLLSQTSRLIPAAFNPDPTYPIAVNINRADNVNAFAPDIQIGQMWRCDACA